jgi:hypothetical protein
MDDTEAKRVEFIEAFNEAEGAVLELCRGHEDKVGLAFYVLGVLEYALGDDQLALRVLETAIENRLFEPI